MITKIEGLGKDMATSTKIDQLQNDLLPPWKNFPMVKRSACLIMSDRLRFLLRRSSSHLTEVAESSTVMSLLQQPVVRYSQMMTCGMTMLCQNQPNRHRAKHLIMHLLPHHLQLRPKRLHRRRLSEENQAIPPVTQRTTIQALSLLINLLLPLQFLRQEKKYRQRNPTIICSRPL